MQRIIKYLKRINILKMKDFNVNLLIFKGFLVQCYYCTTYGDIKGLLVIKEPLLLFTPFGKDPENLQIIGSKTNQIK